VLLVTCVKRKRSAPAAARDLYISDLFVKERSYAEHLGVPWYIHSTEHGVLTADDAELAQGVATDDRLRRDPFLPFRPPQNETIRITVRFEMTDDPEPQRRDDAGAMAHGVWTIGSPMPTSDPPSTLESSGSRRTEAPRLGTPRSAPDDLMGLCRHR
jgi:Family of unknown function (DUF6884)